MVKENVKKYIFFLVIPICAIFFMIYVDTIWQPDYWLRSICKIGVFAGIPIVFAYVFKISLRELFRWHGKKSFLISLGLGVLTYIGILVLYAGFSRLIDLNQIRTTLGNTMNVNAENFIFVALYIACINSFLEEFFFSRYFVFEDEGTVWKNICLWI